jgi:ABC-type oligopeptide transport system ATPase subunit
MSTPLLSVRNLQKYFPTSRNVGFRKEKLQVKAVDGISFDLMKGETLGLVGESGCGKTTAGRTILKLIEPTAGEIVFDGKDITKLRPGLMTPLLAKKTPAIEGSPKTKMVLKSTNFCFNLDITPAILLKPTMAKE